MSIQHTPGHRERALLTLLRVLHWAQAGTQDGREMEYPTDEMCEAEDWLFHEIEKCLVSEYGKAIGRGMVAQLRGVRP